MKLNRKRLFLLTSLFFIVSFIHSQSDTIFWFVAPDIAQKHNNEIFEIPLTFNIASSSNKQVNVKISQPASSTFSTIYKTIPANSSIEIDVSSYVDELENKPANTILNKGILIETSDFVSIYYSINLGNADPESYSLKGRNALGTEFFIPGQNEYTNGGMYSSNYEIPPYSKFDIVATMDNTQITITPSNDIIGHNAQTPFTITLNKGQTYSAVAISKLGSGHLAGSYIISDKSIAITISDDLLGIDGTQCADLIGDQIVPIDNIGMEYIVIKGQLAANNDRVYLTATQNNTSVTFFGSNTNNIVLSKGETKGFYYKSNSNTIYLISDKPVYCFQLTGIGCELGGAIVPSMFCTGSFKVMYRRGIANDNKLYLNVYTKASAISSFSINGNTSYLTSNDFDDVEGTNGKWKYATINLSSIISQYRLLKVENNELFHMATFDGNTIWGCSYNYFSDFEQKSDLSIAMKKNTFCIGDSITISYNYKNLKNIECICPNGNIMKTPPFNINFATETDSGIYIIKGEGIAGCDNIIYDSIFIHLVSGIKTICYDTICQGEHYVNRGIDTTFFNPGIYYFDSLINCDTLRLEILVKPSHYFHTYYDSICEGEHYVGYGIDTFFYEKGTYVKYYSYKCDSLIKIQVYIKKAANVSLGKDIILCSDLDFPVKIDAENSFKHYQWNTFENTPYIYVDSVGTYYITVTNNEGCSHSDTISVFLEKIPIEIELLTDDFCENFSATLQVTTESDSILWNTGDSLHQIEITKPGIYTVAVFKKNCVNKDSIFIDTCAFKLFLPNAITPSDNNGINDYFYLKLPKKNQVISIHIDFFDRWGNNVFSSDDIDFRWFGKINEKQAQNNVFNYILQVKLDDNRYYVFRGFLLVM